MLESCSRCFENLCSEEYAIAGKCDVARKTLIDSLVVKFRDSVQEFFAEVSVQSVTLSLICSGRNFQMGVAYFYTIQFENYIINTM